MGSEMCIRDRPDSTVNDFCDKLPSSAPSVTPTGAPVPATGSPSDSFGVTPPPVSAAPTDAPTTAAPTTATPSAAPILGSVAGTVTEDADEDAVCAKPLPGVLITLTDAPGAVVATTLTDSNGNYEFVGLPIAVYRVSETNLVGFIDVSEVDGNNDNTLMVSLTFPQPDSTSNDFCDKLPSTVPSGSPSSSPSVSPSASPSVAPRGSVSGTVQEDVDDDDVCDKPMPGVTVTLTDLAGDTIATTVTDSNGNYQFTDLPIGAYKVVETNLPGYIDVSEVDGVNDNSLMVSLTFPQPDSTLNDFCDKLPSVAPSGVPSAGPTSSPSASPSAAPRGSISGSVEEDIDEDGTCEKPIPGVVVTLTTPGGQTVATTLTDSNGLYEFSDLPIGVYAVVETNLPGYVDVSEVDGVTDNEVTVSLTFPKPNSANIDFCDKLPSSAPSASPTAVLVGSISGNVKEDIDGDGDGDVDIPEVLITLFDSSNTPVATTLTDSEGDYLFIDVPVGVYFVRESDPVGFTSVKDVDPVNDNLVTVSLIFTRLNSTENNFVDERLPAPSATPSTSAPSSSAPSFSPSAAPSASPVLGSIAGTVSEDVDEDSICDKPMEGVLVSLSDAEGSTVSTTLTDSNGAYKFTDLPIGVYSVSETNLPGFIDVSEVDGVNDNTLMVSLTIPQPNSTENDFCDKLPSSAPSGAPTITASGSPTPGPHNRCSF